MNIKGQINQKGLSMGQPPPPRKHVLGILVYVDPQTLNFPNASKIYAAVCDGTQNVKRYRYFFSGTKYFRYRYQYFFQYQKFSDNGSKTFLRYQIFPIPNPRLFSGTNVFRYADALYGSIFIELYQ